MKAAVPADVLVMSDYTMPDLMRIGGVSGWMCAAALAHAAGVSMSTHLFSEFSAHLMCITPTAHWLEYVDWPKPQVKEPLTIRDGSAVAREVPGNGMVWDEAAVAKYRFT